MDSRRLTATRVTASTLGVLVGLAGIDHGLFEILQGNVAPAGLMFDAIGPDQRFWEYGVETALTIVPNLLVTGVLAVIVGLAVVVWAGVFVERKRGAGILMLLSTILFLVGGGFAPIFMSVVASLAASRIGKPLTLWRRFLPGVVRRILAKVWPGVLIAFVVTFLVSVEVAIFGWPLTALVDAERALELLSTFSSTVMLGLMLFSVVTAFARDTQVGLAIGDSPPA
jgi:hypothetical protein